MKNKDIKNKQSLGKIIKNNWFILKIAIKESPLYTLDELIQGMLHHIVVFVEHVYMLVFIMDSIEHQKPFLNVLIFISSVFAFLFVSHLWGNYRMFRMRPKAVEKINKKIRLSLYKKASEIDIECYDNPEFFNDFVWAMSDVTDRVAKVMQSTSDFLGAVVGIFIVGGYIFTQDKFGLALAVFSVMGILIFGTLSTKLQFKLETELKPIQRKRDYINRVLYLSEYAKEVRLSNVKSKLYEDFSESVDNMEKVVRKHSKKLSVYWFILEYVFNFFIFDGLYIIYLLFMTIVKKAFSFPTMFGLYRSCGMLADVLIKFARVIPDFQKHSLYIDKIRSFLDYEIKIKSKENTVDMPVGAKALELKNVSFAYNETSEPTLNNISLTINKGEKVALVGYNGAGKTTLVKTLMRLYDVTGGEILYDGINIKDYKVDEYRNAYATVFQDYQLFSASLGENVVMDNNGIDEEKAIEMLKTNGFGMKFDSLEKGLETPLTKEFEENGVNLSGGESQKVAISRALYKDSPIIILDEPSSALDPIAEYNLNNTMLHLSNDKTIIFISHRLSTTKMADKIYMLENGQIIEQGNHNELLALDGKYAQMFNLQAEKYR